MTIPLFEVTGQSGTFTDYTLDTGVLDYSHSSHSYFGATTVHFNSVDTSNIHKFRVTFTSMATPCVNLGYGQYANGQAQMIDRDGNNYINDYANNLIPTPYNSSPWTGTYTYDIQTGPYIDGFGNPANLIHVELNNNIFWPTIGIMNVQGGTVQFITRIQSIDDGGGIIVIPNSCQMIVEQN